MLLITAVSLQGQALGTAKSVGERNIFRSFFTQYSSNALSRQHLLVLCLLGCYYLA